MNIVKKLTFRHLKANKSRTVVTIGGILVSVAMITAVFVSVASFLNLFGQLGLMLYGNCHGKYYSVSPEQVEQLRKDERVLEVGLFSDDSETSAFLLNQRVSDRTGTGDIYTGDAVNLDEMLGENLEGFPPQNGSQIAVEEELIEKNNLNWKIGDIVEIPIGYRYIMEGEEQQIIAGSWYSEEQFAETGVGVYEITGILHDNLSTSGAAVVLGMDDPETVEKLCASVVLKKADYTALKQIREIAEDYSLTDYNYNTDYFESIFALDEDSALVQSILPMALFVLIIIIVASVMLIYNAFGMSLSERVRYLGMLASVGATKKQKRGSVYFEGFLLGLIGIPAGILAGILGIGITLKVVGGRIVSTGMINGFSDSGAGLDMIVPLWCILGILFFSALTIFISAFIPARKASAVTPIDAIRQTNEVKAKGRKLRTPGYIRLFFGYEGELAHKNMKRNGRKSRVITASIAMSVILFLCVQYFCQMFHQANSMESEVPYQIGAMVPYGDREQIRSEVEKMAGVDRVYIAENTYFMYHYDKDPYLNQDLADPANLTDTYKHIFDEVFYIFVNVIDDTEFRKICETNGLDPEEYFTSDDHIVRGIALNNISHREGGSKVFKDSFLGSRIFYDSAKLPGEIEIAGFAEYREDNYVFHLSPKNCVSVYVPESMYYQKYLGESEETTVMLGIETDSHKSVYELVSAFIEAGNYRYSYCTDVVASLQTSNTVIFVLEVFTYGFIVLISLITIANIINTISTGITLRRKEFAMLKSVGITPRGFRKMICLESLLYGIRALLIGLPVSILASYKMNQMLGSDAIPFEISWLLYGAVVLVVFAVVGLTMLYAVSKLKKASIVETLKEEIS